MSATVESHHPPSYDVSDSLSALRHHWWLVALVALLGLGGAGAWLNVQEPVWESTTSVLVHPVGQDTNVIGGRTQGQVNLDTEAQLVRSTAVASGAAERLGDGAAPEELARQVSIEVPPNTSVLMISFTDHRPERARAGSAAFAEAYLAHREQAARAALGTQIEALTTKIAELDTTLADINERLATTLPNTSLEANLDSQRSTVTSQLSSLTGRLNELTTATITAGDVISEARTPTEPAGPHAGVILASGTALGLVAGVGAAGVAHRTARRIRRPRDLVRRLGIPVLATLAAGRSRTAAGLRSDELLSPYAMAGRMVDRLRNEVLASTTGKVILVTSATAGPGSSFVAGNLAASLARAGHEVILASARVPENVAAINPLTRLLGIAATPGLSEVLAGRATVAEALQRAPRHPRMRAMTMGGTASATGLLQQPTLRDVLRTLMAQAEYVVVDAPPTIASADTQSLARHSDVALLVIEPRRARLADAADAADQLRRVGTTLLGAVVVPSMRIDPAGALEHAPERDAATAPEGEPGDAGDRQPGPGPAQIPAWAGDPADAGIADRDAEANPAGRAGRAGSPRPGPHSPLPGDASREGDTVVMPRLDQGVVVPTNAGATRSR